MSCVKKGILIGGKEKEDRYACFEKVKGGENKKKTFYPLKPSCSHCHTLDSRSDCY